MQRLFTPCFSFVVLLTGISLASCTNKVTCHELSGRWTTQEGHEFVFLQDGKALWLTRFGSQFDTVPFKYRLDCRPEPATINLTDFDNGPYSGKTLLGILEWTSDTSFRLRYESGTAEDLRPKEFDNDATMKFFPAK